MYYKLESLMHRSPRVLDHKPEKSQKHLPYLTPQKPTTITTTSSIPKKHKKHQKPQFMHHYNSNQSVTVLSVRLTQPEQPQKSKTEDSITYIRRPSKDNIEQQQQNKQKQDNQKLPHLRYRKFQSPEQHLKAMGYNPDTRLPEEIYSDRIEERRINYSSKLDQLRKQMQNLEAGEKRYNMGDRSRIQIKLLGEEIRRKRERDLLIREDRKGQQLFQSMLTKSTTQ